MSNSEEIQEKKIALADMLEQDRIDSTRIQIRRSIILKYQREIAEAEGNTPDVPEVSTNTQPTARQLRDDKDRLRSLIVEVLDRNQKPMKFADLEEAVKDKFGKDINIRDDARALQGAKRIGIMKLNHANKYSFWILPSWIDRANNTLYPDYHIPAMTMFADVPIIFT